MATRPLPQITPNAFNWWNGNQFMIPPLGEYARPIYDDALKGVQDPALQQALNPQQGGVGGTGPDGAQPGGSVFGGGQSAGSLPGVGMNATTTSAKDFLGALTTGPVGAALGVMGQMAYNGIMGQPDKPITSAGLAGAIFGGGDNGPQIAPPGSGIVGMEDRSLPPGASLGGFGLSPEIAGRGYEGGVDSGGYSSADQGKAETGGYQGSGMYNKGGFVNSLVGPNPPGPDDGYGGLQRGEMVINAEATAKNRGLLEHMNKSKKKVSRGLLSR